MSGIDQFLMPASDDQYTLNYDAKVRCHDIISGIIVLLVKDALHSDMTNTRLSEIADWGLRLSDEKKALAR